MRRISASTGSKLGLQNLGGSVDELVAPSLRQPARLRRHHHPFWGAGDRAREVATTPDFPRQSLRADRLYRLTARPEHACSGLVIAGVTHRGRDAQFVARSLRDMPRGAQAAAVGERAPCSQERWIPLLAVRIALVPESVTDQVERRLAALARDLLERPLRALELADLSLELFKVSGEPRHYQPRRAALTTTAPPSYVCGVESTMPGGCSLPCDTRYSHASARAAFWNSSSSVPSGSTPRARRSRAAAIAAARWRTVSPTAMMGGV